MKKFIFTYITYDGTMKSKEAEGFSEKSAERTLKNCREVMHTVPCNVTKINQHEGTQDVTQSTYSTDGGI